MARTDGRRWSRVLLGVAAALSVLVLLVVVAVVLMVRRVDDVDASATVAAGCAESSEELVRDATAGRAGRVESALADGADPDQRDEHDNTALACAGPAGHADVVALLLDAGADPATVARDGDTVVADAVRFCRPDVLALLLEAGADPEVSGSDTTPLDQAVDRGSADTVTRLLDAGAEPVVTYRIVLFDEESTSPCPDPTPRSRAEALDAVLQGGGDPDTVLVAGVRYRAFAVVAPALAAGADPDVDVTGEDADDAGSRVLFCPSSEPDDVRRCDPVAGLTTVLHGPPDMSTTTSEGTTEPADTRPETPLLHAAWAGDGAAIDQLVAAGADPDHVGPGGFTALHAAAGAGRDDAVALLLPVTTVPVPGGAAPPSRLAEAAGHHDLSALLAAAGA